MASKGLQTLAHLFSSANLFPNSEIAKSVDWKSCTVGCHGTTWWIEDDYGHQHDVIEGHEGDTVLDVATDFHHCYCRCRFLLCFIALAITPSSCISS